jgi:hypothetical protein
MRSLVFVMACALAAGTAVADGSAPATATTGAAPAKGQMVVSSNGARLGTVYRVNPDGSAQIILDGKMVTIPAATLSASNGKLTTSLSKSEVSSLN